MIVIAKVIQFGKLLWKVIMEMWSEFEIELDGPANAKGFKRFNSIQVELDSLEEMWTKLEIGLDGLANAWG